MDNPSSDMQSTQSLNFEFAYNNANFSDRVLHIEIIADSEGEELGSENVIEVKALNISSSILAANSPFFLKLFNNGMRESQEKDATLRINQSEDAALTDLLKFMYTNTLNATTTPDLLDVLIIADKFEVTSCIKYCRVLLEKRPMSLESALSYIELPRRFLVVELVQPLIDVAKKWLIARFKDIIKSEKEVMTLPLSAVEVVLGCDTLRMDSKDYILEFILKCNSFRTVVFQIGRARAHYPKLEVRREILTKRLTQLIPFPSMSYSKLKEVLVCPDFEHEKVSKLVFDALFFKAQLPYEQRISSSNKCQLIKLEKFELPHPSCVIYFNLRKEDCENLSQSNSLQSPSFCLGGRWFYLLARCYSSYNSYTREQDKTFCLFFYLEKKSESFRLDYEYAMIKKSSKEFTEMCNGKINDCDIRNECGYEGKFGIPWPQFMSKDNEFFIDGILHFRADLTIHEGRYPMFDYYPQYSLDMDE